MNDFYDRLLESSVDASDELPYEIYLFVEALDDDLNTSKALGVFFDWLRKTNLQLDNESITDDEIARSINFVEKFNSIFDLLTPKSKIPKEVAVLVKLREEARNNKDWDKADSLRDEINELGWSIEDTKDGMKFKKNNIF